MACKEAIDDASKGQLAGLAASSTDENCTLKERVPTPGKMQRFVLRSLQRLQNARIFEKTRVQRGHTHLQFLGAVFKPNHRKTFA